jgi:phosphate/sulfate permease
MQKKRIIFTIAVILLMQLSLAQTIVQVQQPQTQPEKTSIFSFAFLKSPIFLGLVLFIVLAGVIAICLFIFIRWIIKYIKQRNDMFYKLKVERLKLAKIHSTYPSKHWYNVEKNIPIRLIRRINNISTISSPIAYHRGDFISNEGNYIIALNFVNKKKWFIFPITDLLVVPNNQKVRLVQKDKDGKKINETIISLPKAEDILKFHNREILIHADSLSHSGMFYIPVIKSREGNVVDLALPIYQTLKNIVLEDYLYETTSEFASLSKKAMDLNPHIRAIQKTSDSNQSVELPTN